MNTTVYYSPEAVGSPHTYFVDKNYMYERVHGLGSLGTLDGWLKRIGRKLKKVAKKAAKVVKKVAKTTAKVLRKVLPVVNTALTFVPGVGWAAKAALTAVEIGLNVAHKASLRRARRRKMKLLNSKRTRPVKKVTPVNRTGSNGANQADRGAFHSNQADRNLSARHRTQKQAIRIPRPPVYTTKDFIKINKAVTRDALTPQKILALSRTQYNQSLEKALNF